MVVGSHHGGGGWWRYPCLPESLDKEHTPRGALTVLTPGIRVTTSHHFRIYVDHLGADTPFT